MYVFMYDNASTLLRRGKKYVCMYDCMHVRLSACMFDCVCTYVDLVVFVKCVYAYVYVGFCTNM